MARISTTQFILPWNRPQIDCGHINPYRLATCIKCGHWVAVHGNKDIGECMSCPIEVYKIG